VGRLLLIDVVFRLPFWGVWTLFFTTIEIKGATLLRWVPNRLRRQGTESWNPADGNPPRLQARLHFPSRWFENAWRDVKFSPRALPIQWLISCWHKQKETLTFEADLTVLPVFRLEVVRHRWCPVTAALLRRQRDDREWDIYEPGPVILTTRRTEAGSLGRIECADVGAGQDILQVHFRPESHSSRYG